MPHRPSPRRRSQFRLRTLMIGVMLFCVSAAWFTEGARTVREWKAILAHEPISLLVSSSNSTSRISWVRRWLDDVDCRLIGTEPVSNEKLEHDRAVFPEAIIKRSSDPP